MTRTPDPLLRQLAAERLHYSTGELLGADDFRDEQTYHRRQLARALLHHNGSGTVAGLRVAARHQPSGNGAPDEVHLEVRLPHVLAIEHSRNFGSQNAFVSGMQFATGDAVILLDGDLQDPPELIPAFYAKWREGYHVVYGQRNQRWLHSPHQSRQRADHRQPQQLPQR